MSQLLKKGTLVRQVVHVIDGTIVGSAVHDDELKYEVEYIGEDGETHRRWFTLEEVEEAK